MIANIVIIALIALALGGIAARAIINRRKGKTSACACCSASASCNTKDSCDVSE
jgi:hypothetical protein